MIQGWHQLWEISEAAATEVGQWLCTSVLRDFLRGLNGLGISSDMPVNLQPD
jgi:hypothetical protein